MIRTSPSGVQENAGGETPIVVNYSAQTGLDCLRSHMCFVPFSTLFLYEETNSTSAS